MHSILLTLSLFYCYGIYTSFIVVCNIFSLYRISPLDEPHSPYQNDQTYCQDQPYRSIDCKKYNIIYQWFKLLKSCTSLSLSGNLQNLFYRTILAPAYITHIKYLYFSDLPTYIHQTGLHINFGIFHTIMMLHVVTLTISCDVLFS